MAVFSPTVQLVSFPTKPKRLSFKINTYTLRDLVLQLSLKHLLLHFFAVSFFLEILLVCFDFCEMGMDDLFVHFLLAFKILLVPLHGVLVCCVLNWV
jgi:hypothetical protein